MLSQSLTKLELLIFVSSFIHSINDDDDSYFCFAFDSPFFFIFHAVVFYVLGNRKIFQLIYFSVLLVQHF